MRKNLNLEKNTKSRVKEKQKHNFSILFILKLGITDGVHGRRRDFFQGGPLGYFS